MLLEVEAAGQGRVSGTEGGKGAIVSAWPGGGRCRAQGSERLQGWGDYRRPQDLVTFLFNLTVMGQGRF